MKSTAISTRNRQWHWENKKNNGLPPLFQAEIQRALTYLFYEDDSNATRNDWRSFFP